MNILQTCALHYYAGNASAWLPFIHCLENHGSNQQKYAQTCATASGLNWDTLNKCWTGAEGAQLEWAAGAVTNALVPPHTFVPWVTLGSTPGTFCEDSNCDTFLSAVCNAYQGTPPSACSSVMEK